LGRPARSGECRIRSGARETHRGCGVGERHLRGFLQRIGYFEPAAVAFVELVDDRGRFAWSAGRFVGGGMVHPRPDLDECSPIGHSQLVGAKPPPCPAN
jgi:hypothetical protein